MEFYDKPGSWDCGPCAPAGIATVEADYEDAPPDDHSKALATISGKDDHRRAEGVLLAALRDAGRGDLADAFVEARERAGFLYGPPAS